MKKRNLSFIILLITHFGISQTTLFSENFETGNTFTLNSKDLGASTNYNIWLMNNVYSGGSGTFTCPIIPVPLTFNVINTPSQPQDITGAPNSNYMHITAQAAIASGINCSSYIAADGLCVLDESNFSKMSSSISTLGYTEITFNFWWLCKGSINAFGEIYYSLDDGMTWILKQSNLNNESNWTQSSLSDVNWNNIPSLRFAFRYVNNITRTATDPPFSIDDVSVIANKTLGITTNNDTLINSIIYPNPTKGALNISLNKTFNNIKINILDISGKKIDIKHFKNTKQLKLKLLNNSGIYFLNIEADSEKFNYKIIKH